MLKKPVIRFFASLHLTVVCLGLGIVLVFWGTLAQVHLGLYQAQNEFFRSLLIFWQPGNGRPRIPIFPGGYLIGGVLLINLIAAHAARFRFTWRKSGILLAHSGLILLLVGQMFTDIFSSESAMRLTVGETRNYSEDFHTNELAISRTENAKTNELITVPESEVARQGEIAVRGLTAKLRVKAYWPNCELIDRPPVGAQPSGAVRGSFARHLIVPLAAGGSTQSVAAVLLEIVSDAGTLGPWLVVSHAEEPEHFRLGGRRWNMSLVLAPAMKGNFLILADPERPQGEQPDPIGERELAAGDEIAPAHAPFRIRVRQFWSNCRLSRAPTSNAVAPGVTNGAFASAMVEPLPPRKDTDDRNQPAAVVEVIAPAGSLGTWLLAAAYNAKQGFKLDGADYEMALRFTRHYKPFSITLLDAEHKKYLGTEIPRDFRSRVRLLREDTGEARETEIYMNAPLRFAGYTFFQYQMAADEAALHPGERPSSTLQVVQNPSWLTPYVSCALVGAGLLVQFLMHLAGFIAKRKYA